MTAQDSTAPAARPRRGIATVADVRARCTVDAVTHCWHWRGAMGTDGVPRLHAFCHDCGEKRTQSGPRAVWQVAHGRAPLQGWLVLRRCLVGDCLNPAHLREVRSKAEVGLHVRRSGRRKGTHRATRVENLRHAWAASGIRPTPAAVVQAIRAAPAGVLLQTLAEQFGLDRSTVGRIRRGDSRADLTLTAAPARGREAQG